MVSLFGGQLGTMAVQGMLRHGAEAGRAERTGPYPAPERGTGRDGSSARAREQARGILWRQHLAGPRGR